MQIESIIRRKNGTTVTLGDKTYFFHSPKADGAHVATVDDDDHAQHLLSIKEGFKIYRAKETVVEPPVEAGAPVELSRAELIAAYKAKFGKAPNPNMGTEKLRSAMAQE